MTREQKLTGPSKWGRPSLMRIWRYAALPWVVAALLSISVVVVGLVLVLKFEIGDSLTVASLLIAIVLGIVGYIRSRNDTIRAHTIDILALLSTNSTLVKSDAEMINLIVNNVRLSGDYPPKILNRNDTNVSEEDIRDEYIINLLDFYEYLATVWSMDAVDEEVLFDIRGGAMSRAYDVCEQYIENRRDGAPDLYRNYQRLVEEYRKREDSRNGADKN